MRTLLLLVATGLVLFAGLFAAACEDGDTSTTAASTGETTATMVELPDTIKVGAVIPLTGKYAALGGQVIGGYELAVEDINAAGGVDVGGTKIPIELSILDDESDATKTVQQLETHNSNGVVAYLGGAGSDLHAAASGIAEKNKIPYLGIAFALQSVHDQGFEYLFSPFPKSSDQARTTFDLLDSFDPKPGKVAIVQETTDWGAELTGFWQAEADARGGYEVTVHEYAPGTTDYSSIVLDMKEAKVEAVLALPIPPDGLALMKQMKELDFNASVYFMIRAPDGPTFGENLGVDSDGVYLLPGWNSGVPYEGVTGMVQRYMDKYDKPAVALTGPAYACVQILADAINRAGAVDRDSIRDAIVATDLDTVVGHVTFNPDGTWINALCPVSQWQGGKQELVFPEDVSLVDPLYPAVPWKDR